MEKEDVDIINQYLADITHLVFHWGLILFGLYMALVAFDDEVTAIAIVSAVFIWWGVTGRREKNRMSTNK